VNGLAPRHEDEPYAACGSPEAGFSLLEVMIAMFVFFIVVFAVLSMVVQSLSAARALQYQQADPGMVASMTSMSNVLEELSDSGDFEGLVEGYRWERTITEVGSNGLFQVDITVFKNNAKGKEVGESMSVLMFRPGGRKRR
jgi:Tfp pilus assembly protein PilV